MANEDSGLSAVPGVAMLAMALVAAMLALASVGRLDGSGLLYIVNRPPPQVLAPISSTTSEISDICVVGFRTSGRGQRDGK